MYDPTVPLQLNTIFKDLYLKVDINRVGACPCQTPERDREPGVKLTVTISTVPENILLRVRKNLRDGGRR